ncbi:MAG: hypothetical protein A2133_01235 [Actinobacteria bacterium RBG_16_64_13]|nr:MAG: hypothetical protein A2133_01235 [Actinobacteria bacterium RBG_16_64_13]
MTDTIRVDLHCHSSASDGDHSPAYVAHSVAAVGVVWAALTDHNTIDGQEAFRAALERRGVNSILGLEIATRSQAVPVHLLAYSFHPDNEPLLQSLRTIREPWRSSARHWMYRARSLTGRPPGTERPCSPPGEDPSPHRPPGSAEVICLVHSAGGRVFLAHPLAGVRTIERLEKVLDLLQSEGLDGIEAFHSQYPETVRRRLLEIAERRDLLTVGGSDFHGLHHSDGASPGVDMPLVHWNRFVAALGLGSGQGPASDYSDRPTMPRGRVGY